MAGPILSEMVDEEVICQDECEVGVKRRRSWKVIIWHMTVKVVAFSLTSYADGFMYPPEFVQAVLGFWPEEENEGELSKILHDGLKSGDTLVGRFLSDSAMDGKNKEAVRLYKWWSEIDDRAPQEATGDEGFMEGFSVRNLKLR